jgi:hypothetical protein
MSDPGLEAERSGFRVSGKVGLWPSSRPDGGWHYLIVDGQTAMEIRYAALGRTGGFSSIRVGATIGKTSWQTSLFPHRESGGLLLLLKAEVRRREKIRHGGQVTVDLTI